MTRAKLDATGHRWVAVLSNYTFGITYKPGKGHVDADALSNIRWSEAIDIDTETVHAVCKGVQALHGKVEKMCGALAWLEFSEKMEKRNAGYTQKTVLLGHR